MTRLALLQARAFEEPAKNLARTVSMIRKAAAGGAQIVCTQELCTTRYFCQMQDPGFFDLAEPVPGPVTEQISSVAAECGVVVVFSFFEERASGLYHNTALVFDADGSLLGSYRKMHIPQDPGFEEKFYFTPGDHGYQTWKTRHGRIGVIICWDQWFPEAARLTAMAGAEIILCPTAIGWLPEEKEALGAAQYTAWETVQRGHAVANGCHFAAINRVGTEGQSQFWGQSFVSDHCGQVIAQASVDEEEILFADCDIAAQNTHRRMWPFFRDRRIDSYGDLIRRFGD